MGITVPLGGEDTPRTKHSRGLLQVGEYRVAIWQVLQHRERDNEVGRLVAQRAQRHTIAYQKCHVRIRD